MVFDSGVLVATKKIQLFGEELNGSLCEYVRTNKEKHARKSEIGKSGRKELNKIPLSQRRVSLESNSLCLCQS